MPVACAEQVPAEARSRRVTPRFPRGGYKPFEAACSNPEDRATGWLYYRLLRFTR